MGKAIKKSLKGKTAEVKGKGRGSGMFSISGWYSEEYISLIVRGMESL